MSLEPSAESDGKSIGPSRKDSRCKYPTIGEAMREDLDRLPRQSLAARILAVLEHHGVSYGVLRNPNRLMDEGQGDLDIWVPATSILPAMDLIEREAEAAGWWLLKRVRRPYVCSLYMYRPGHRPSALTVDAFPAIRWLVADLLPEELLSRSLVREGNVWIVDPRVGALASILHHLAWNGRVPSRYVEAYLRLDSDDLPYSELVQRIARDPSPSWRSSRRRLLGSAVAATLRTHPLRAAIQAVHTLASLGRSSPGRWVVFDGPEADRYLIEIDKRLHDEHFLVGRWGSMDRVPKGALARRKWYAMNVLMKRRLGAIILSSGDPGDLGPDARVLTTRSGWKVQDHERAEPRGEGESVQDCFQYLLTWLASECRVDTPKSGITKGLIVGLVGPDGSGKSTLAQYLEADGGLQPAARYHWRPGILPPLGGFAKANTGAPNQRPGTATQGWLVSLGRLAYYWLDTQLGFATTLGRQKRAGLLVLIERSFLDVVVDPTRYGFRLPRWVLEIATRISLKPQLLLNLSLPASHAVARKAELSIGETERQAHMWRTFPARLVDTRNLDASAAPIDLAHRAMQVIAGAREIA
jgi:hypothetical protein